MRRAGPEPSCSWLRRNRRIASAFMTSPALVARGTPSVPVQRGLAPARLAAVLDVVVDEEGVVQELDAGGRRQRVLRAPAVARDRSRGKAPAAALCSGATRIHESSRRGAGSARSRGMTPSSADMVIVRYHSSRSPNGSGPVCEAGPALPAAGQPARRRALACAAWRIASSISSTGTRASVESRRVLQLLLQLLRDVFLAGLGKRLLELVNLVLGVDQHRCHGAERGRDGRERRAGGLKRRHCLTHHAAVPGLSGSEAGGVVRAQRREAPAARAAARSGSARR